MFILSALLFAAVGLVVAICRRGRKYELCTPMRVVKQMTQPGGPTGKSGLLGGSVSVASHRGGGHKD